MKMDTSMFERFGVTFGPDDIIFCEYEPGKDFYILQEGRVKVTKIVSDMEKTLDVFHPGDIFGEMAIIEDQPRSATAIAIDKVKILKLNKESFSMLIQGTPQLVNPRVDLVPFFLMGFFTVFKNLLVLSYRPAVEQFEQSIESRRLRYLSGHIQ